MQTALVCLCLCLLNTALSTPVPPSLPGRAAENCVGQHRILLKGCNAKHGFYMLKYIYAYSTQRNQMQIKKEEADRQTTVSSHQLGKDDDRLALTEDQTSLERGDNISASVVENRPGLQAKNHSAPGAGEAGHSLHPGTSTRARGGIGIAGLPLASSEGSGDLDLVVEVEGGVSLLPEDGQPSKDLVGNMSSVRSEDRDDGAAEGGPVEQVMTAGREKAPATGGAGNEGSGEAIIPVQGQESIMEGTGVGGTAHASVTEKMEDVQVDAEGVDEYAYIPESASVTITRGKAGSTGKATSFTQISPDEDDEVHIFIEKANIHVGEQETTQAGAAVGSKDDGIPTMGTSSPLLGMGVTAAQGGDDNDDIPAHRQPERLATAATPSHVDSVTTSPRVHHPTGDDKDGATKVRHPTGDDKDGATRVRHPTGDDKDGATKVRHPTGDDKDGATKVHHPTGDDKDGATRVRHPTGDDKDGTTRVRHPTGDDKDGATKVHHPTGDDKDGATRVRHPTGDDKDGATTTGDREGPVAPIPRRVTGDDVTVSTGAAIHGDTDDEVRGEGQRFTGRPGSRAVTTPRQGGDDEAAGAVPAKGASIHMATTVASPSVSEGDCTTALGTGSGHKASKSPAAGRGASGEVGTATPQPHGDRQPRPVVRGQLGGAGQDKQPKTGKAPAPRGKAGSWAPSGTQVKGHGSDARGRPHATSAGAGLPPQAGQARGSAAAASKGQGWGHSGEAGVVAPGTRVGHLPGRRGRRPGAVAMGTFAELGHSRQVDQVKRDNELHVRERAFYSLGGAGGSPRGHYTGFMGADSSQSSEGELGSYSDSQQTGRRPSGW